MHIGERNNANVCVSNKILFLFSFSMLDISLLLLNSNPPPVSLCLPLPCLTFSLLTFYALYTPSDLPLSHLTGLCLVLCSLSTSYAWYCIWYSPSNLPLIHFACLWLVLYSLLTSYAWCPSFQSAPPTQVTSPNVLTLKQANRLEVQEYITHTELVSVHNSNAEPSHTYCAIAALRRCVAPRAVSLDGQRMPGSPVIVIVAVAQALAARLRYTSIPCLVNWRCGSR